MLLKVNPQTIHDEHAEIALFLDYFWAFFEVKLSRRFSISILFIFSPLIYFQS